MQDGNQPKSFEGVETVWIEQLDGRVIARGRWYTGSTKEIREMDVLLQ